MRDPLDSIPGWFDFPRFYDRVVREAPAGALLVEVGVFVGRSLAHLARAARDSGKNLRVWGVDWFKGDRDASRKSPKHPLGNYAGECLYNLQQAGVADSLVLIAAESGLGASVVPDGSAWMVFLDGSHDYRSVRRDIGLWAPKVAVGGILAGHDCDEEGVQQAVNHCLGPHWRSAPEAPRVWESMVVARPPLQPEGA